MSQGNDTDSLKMENMLGCSTGSVMPRLQSFTHQHISSAYCVPGVVLGAGDRAVNETDRPCPHAAVL